MRTNSLRRLFQTIALHFKLLMQQRRQYGVILFDETCANDLGDFRVQVTLTPEPYMLKVKTFEATHLVGAFMLNHKMIEYRKCDSAFYLFCSKVSSKEKELHLYFAETSITIPNPWYFDFQKSSLLLNGPNGNEIHITTDDESQIQTPYLLPTYFVVKNGVEKKVEAYAIREKNTIKIAWHEHLTGNVFTLRICNNDVGIYKT